MVLLGWGGGILLGLLAVIEEHRQDNRGSQGTTAHEHYEWQPGLMGV